MQKPGSKDLTNWYKLSYSKFPHSLQMSNLPHVVFGTLNPGSAIPGTGPLGRYSLLVRTERIKEATETISRSRLDIRNALRVSLSTIIPRWNNLLAEKQVQGSLVQRYTESCIKFTCN